MVISVSYGFVGGVITVTNAKSSAESEKFTLKIRSDNGKLFTIGCHFPPKINQFWDTAVTDVQQQQNYSPSALERTEF